MGIIFCTIIIRVSMGYGFEETTTRNISAPTWRAPRTGTGGMASSHVGGEFDMHPVTVNVSKYVERDTDVEVGSGTTYRYDAEDAKAQI